MLRSKHTSGISSAFGKAMRTSVSTRTSTQRSSSQGRRKMSTSSRSLPHLDAYGAWALHPAGLRLPAPSYWWKRSPFSPRSLLTYLEAGQRKRFRRRLPRPTSVELLSRLETSEGRVRLEYRMSLADPRDILERLLSEIARTHEALAFVLVVTDKTLTSSRASLLTASGVERFRLSRARCKALIRRSNRFWSGDSPISMDEATAAILSECAAHWDAFLASPPEPSNQEY